MPLESALEQFLSPEGALASTLLGLGPNSPRWSPRRNWEQLKDVSPEDRAQAATCGLNLLLAFVGLTEFLPSEPFLVDFLVSKGLTNKEVIDDIFVLWVYWRLPALLMMGVVAECIGCAQTILIGAFFGAATVAMTCFCTSLEMIQVTQFTVAVSTAAHAGACFALVFELSAMTPSGYQLHVHWTKAAFLFSNCAAGLFGGILRRGFGLSYVSISELSLGAQVASVATAIWLACQVKAFEAANKTQPTALRSQSARKLQWGLWSDLCRSVRLCGVARWTVWSIIMHAVHIMVGTFWQALLRGKTHGNNDLNGFASSASFLLSTVTLLGLAKEPRLSDRRIRWSVIVSSLLLSGLLVCCMSQASRPWQFYLAYVSYEVVFSISGAVALQQIGAEVREEAANCGLRGRPECSSPRRPRLALLLSVIQILASLVQSALQLAFAILSEEGRGVALENRFQALGAALCCGAALLVSQAMASELRRQLCRQSG